MALLKKIDQACQNFIWFGDIQNRKLLMISWKKTCHPFLNGGFGLRSWVILNEATYLKLMWNLRTST